MCLAITRVLSQSYNRRFRYLLLCSCDVFFLIIAETLKAVKSDGIHETANYPWLVTGNIMQGREVGENEREVGVGESQNERERGRERKRDKVR